MKGLIVAITLIAVGCSCAGAQPPNRREAYDASEWVYDSEGNQTVRIEVNPNGSTIWWTSVDFDTCPIPRFESWIANDFNRGVIYMHLSREQAQQLWNWHLQFDGASSNPLIFRWPT